jgi:23S rRNA (cytosine1962-C5)-methyltransferase
MQPEVRIRLRPKEEQRLLAGHLWAFSNEVESIEGAAEAGAIAELLRHDGKQLATGFYHPHSLICFRVLAWGAGAIPEDLLRRRLDTAIALRERLLPDWQACRLVHAEADFMPGLLVDRYRDVLAVQITSAGFERLKPQLFELLEQRLRPRAIVERGDTGLRALEELPEIRGLARGRLGQQVELEEGDLALEIDVIGGQKTGAYLDQRCNRFALRRLAPGARVLDLFCYQGGFALHAARAGAASVLGVDQSAAAVAAATAAAARNRLADRCEFREAEVFKLIAQLRHQGRRFDLINLDPPSFTRSKKQVAQARRGYRELHREVLLLLQPGGFLATSCCSHHLEQDVFLVEVERAARTIGRRLQRIRLAGAAPDHPVLAAMPETRYLTCAFYRVHPELGLG